MPESIPLIVEIIVGAATAAQAGYSIYKGVSGSGTPPPTIAPPQAQSAATNQAQQAAVSQTLPNIQALTGGSLSPEYLAYMAPLMSGLGNAPQSSGNVQAALNQFFGLTAPGQTGLTPQSTSAPGGTSITDLLAKAIPAGGAAPTGAVSSGMMSDDFRGFGLG